MNQNAFYIWNVCKKKQDMFPQHRASGLTNLRLQGKGHMINNDFTTEGFQEKHIKIYMKAVDIIRKLTGIESLDVARPVNRQIESKVTTSLHHLTSVIKTQSSLTCNTCSIFL